jgi:SM-20-related protein
MLSGDFLARFGIFICHRFLSDQLCNRIIADIRLGNASQATIGDKHGAYLVDEAVRRVSNVEVSGATLRHMETRFAALKPRLEEYFHVALSHYQRPNFLYYRIGDHYRPHSDSRRENGGAFSRERKVSVVVFLNHPSQQEADGCYGGGQLAFFGLMKAPGIEDRGISLAGEKGLLVAFRSDVVHEVTRVTHGERFTVVTWYASGL